MATRKALVIVNGQIQQIQSGDTLSGLVATGILLTQTNGESSIAIVIGMAVYNTAADSAKRAQANASGTTNVVGLWNDTSTAAAGSGNMIVDGVLTATTTQWDAVAGTSGGLIAGTRYYLSAATPGNLTSTAPSTTGQYVQEVGMAISTTELNVNVKSPILL